MEFYIKHYKLIAFIVLAIFSVALVKCADFPKKTSINTQKEDIIKTTNVNYVEGYKIVSAKDEGDLFRVVFESKEGHQYSAEYLRSHLEDLVCHKGVYEYTDVERVYDCSSPQLIKNAMTQELVTQTIKAIDDINNLYSDI